ncbi:TM1266 family iron-only hydrogenase system putative regulator [Candidatus Formimonas warabiya]|uniref:CopG family transcriptional regulator n=1 Tax=Formimonas warabiya TaxID=1761012 RepID=A0A3G1L0Y4_FORW1|nr:TM1266 family iron-only hydrogenase system putative regulator [Candidatus Formimonas warabiya]ATW28289.1 CopG family transcriptional regulator [Candidatus Formimonas warabiya]
MRGDKVETRLGVIGIVIENREVVAEKVNALLSEFGSIIVGRMGIPYRDRDVSVIALIIDGDTDSVGALTGKLGRLPGVKVKSALTGK